MAGEVEATDRRAALTGSLAASLAVILGGPERGGLERGGLERGGLERGGLERGGPAPPDAAPSPASALAELLAGNRRFVEEEPRYGHRLAGAMATSAGQHPFAVVLGCIDSRVPVEAVFDQDFGGIFVARSAGQVLDRAVLGSIEFAVAEFAIPLVLVVGHTRCGAVQATIDAVRAGERPEGELGYLVGQIAAAAGTAGGELDAAEVTRSQVRHAAARLRRLAPLRGRVDAGALRVTGAIYDVDSGRVEPLP